MDVMERAATLLSKLSVAFYVVAGGFAPRQFSRWASSRRCGLKLVMQRFKFLFACLAIATVVLLSYVAFAQTKTQNPPAVVSAVAPVYAAMIRAVNLEGDFFVDVEIDRNGKVVSSKAVYEKRIFMRKILEEAADRWQFASDQVAEEKRRARLTFTFRATPKASNLDSTTVFYPPYKIEVRSNTVIIDTSSH